MKKIFIATVLSFIGVSAAQAACLPSDITGNWVLYQTNISAQPAHTGRCAISVADNATRTLTGRCTLSNGFAMDVTGSATVNAMCEATLKLNFTGGSMNFGMQLAPDRQSFVGSWKNSFGDVGGTNGVRK
jgi:hypothetical protein